MLGLCHLKLLTQLYITFKINLKYIFPRIKRLQNLPLKVIQEILINSDSYLRLHYCNSNWSGNMFSLLCEQLLMYQTCSVSHASSSSVETYKLELLNGSSKGNQSGTVEKINDKIINDVHGLSRPEWCLKRETTKYR